MDFMASCGLLQMSRILNKSSNTRRRPARTHVKCLPFYIVHLCFFFLFISFAPSVALVARTTERWENWSRTGDWCVKMLLIRRVGCLSLLLSVHTHTHTQNIQLSVVLVLLLRIACIMMRMSRNSSCVGSRAQALLWQRVHAFLWPNTTVECCTSTVQLRQLISTNKHSDRQCVKLAKR